MARKRKTSVIGNPSGEIGIGERWSALLRDHVYVGPNKAKRIQKDWGVALSTAYLWLGGAKPTTDQITEAKRKWGDIVIHFLFGRMPLVSVPDKLELAHEITANRLLAEEALRKNDELARRLAATVGEGVAVARAAPDPIGLVADRPGGEAAEPIAPRRRAGGAR